MKRKIHRKKGESQWAAPVQKSPCDEWESRAVQGQPGTQPVPHMEDLDNGPGPWLQPGPRLSSVTMGGEEPMKEDYLLPFLLPVSLVSTFQIDK